MSEPVIKRCKNGADGCTDRCTIEPGFFEEVKDVFRKGELLVYPTETLYGLGVNPFDKRALERLFKAKMRPKDRPVSVAVSDIAMMETVAQVNDLAKQIYSKHLPGPITMLLKKRDNLPDLLTSGKDTVGIRVPKHPVAQKIIEMVGPITATSANLHGQIEPNSMEIAYNQLKDEVRLYIDCGECKYKEPSTIVDISSSPAKIIRKGVISTKELSWLVEQK